MAELALVANAANKRSKAPVAVNMPATSWSAASSMQNSKPAKQQALYLHNTTIGYSKKTAARTSSERKCLLLLLARAHSSWDLFAMSRQQQVPG